MAGLVRAPRLGVALIGAERTASATNSVLNLTTSATTSVFRANLPEGIQVGDLLVVCYVIGTTTGVTVNPAVIPGFTTRRTWSPSNGGWLVRCAWSVAKAIHVANGYIDIPANTPSNTTGGVQAHVVAFHGQRATTPMGTATAGTGMPTTAAAGTVPFNTWTPMYGGASMFYAAGYLAGATANDGNWTGAMAGYEVLDSLGPRCNTNGGTAHMYTAVRLNETSSPPGTSTLTFGSNRQAREGARLIINPWWI